MNDKLSNKDKEAWDKFVNSKDKIKDKDEKYSRKSYYVSEKTIDLHGYTLENANIEIEKFILLCFERGISKINVITGKGSRSKNKEDPYQSKDLSILKYSVPNYIKENRIEEKNNFILEIRKNIFSLKKFNKSPQEIYNHLKLEVRYKKFNFLIY